MSHSLTTLGATRAACTATEADQRTSSGVTDVSSPKIRGECASPETSRPLGILALFSRPSPSLLSDTQEGRIL